MIRNTVLAAIFVLLSVICSAQKPITTEVAQLSGIRKVIQDTIFKNAHVGFVLLDEKSGKYVEEYNADKYFIPASNTKLFTTYACLKYLKDSLSGFYYRETKDTLYLKPNADPTFLHSDFKEQKVFDKIRNTKKVVVLEKVLATGVFRLGNGWPWATYQTHQMPERTVMPIYGNLVRFNINGNSVIASPRYFQKSVKINGDINGKRVVINRSMDDNTFTVSPSTSNVLVRSFTHKADPDLAYKLLQDTLAFFNKKIEIVESQKRPKNFWKPFYTHKTEDVVKPMMYDSNNFLAEQLLLLAGTQIHGQINDRLTISHLNTKDLATLSNKFTWYDGSGWSRYNNVTPRALTDLLVKMKKEFGWEKVNAVVSHGNIAALKNYYVGYEKNIYAKGGRLDNTVWTFSGYLITKKDNKYIFSFESNNHAKNPEHLRRTLEKYLIEIIENR